MGDEEARQIPQVQAEIFVYRKVGPPLVELDTRTVSRRHSPDPSSHLTCHLPS